jgi:4-amino-4-deoxy-L-arabinose transferase-like glycosyltransferase
MQALSVAVIALLLAVLTLNRLGAADVCGGSEAAMAVYVQQMMEGNRLLFPLDNCSIPMYKPPLYHWTAAALAALLRFAAATPFVLRLPSAVYAIFGAILTMAVAANLLGLRGSILAGLILCGSYQYISQARIGLVDMTLTFFETLALYSFLGWLVLDAEAPVRGFRRIFLHYVFAVAMGLGVLAKGPVGAILPGGAMVLFLLVEKDWKRIKAFFRLGPLIAGAVIASSWYVACFVGGRFDFLSLQIGSENVGRFFGALGTMSPWYYVQPLLLNSLPLSLVVPFAVISALRSGTGASAASTEVVCSPIHIAQGQRVRLAVRFLAIFWILTVIFFELASYKRRAYLLPLWPASALLLSWWVVERIMPWVGATREVFIYRTAVATCALLSAANFVFVPAYELHQCGSPFTPVALLRWPSAGFSGESSIDSGQTASYRAVATKINRLIEMGQPLYVFGFSDALEPLVFYLGRCVQPLHSLAAAPQAGYTLTTERWWERSGGAASELTPVARVHYENDDLVVLRPGRSGSTQRGAVASPDLR